MRCVKYFSLGGLVLLAVLAPLEPADSSIDKPKVKLKLIGENFRAPLFLVAPDDGSGRKFVGDQIGIIHVIDAQEKLLKVPFLDLRDRLTPLLKAFDERGLLALAFHPNFSRNGKFYVNYSGKRRLESPFRGKTAYTWRLSEFRVSPSNPNLADLRTERKIMEFDWVNRKHNGGGLAFGPDGYLYIGVGDGGGVHGVPDIYIREKREGSDLKVKEDPFTLPERFHKYDRYAQDTLKLKGKILRIDINNHGDGYGIPKTNIFRGKIEGRDEIYAWGFRNPFRLSFDRAGNGHMFVSGVAETYWESIFLVDRQGNYGWAKREGTHCFDRARIFDPPKKCSKIGILGEIINDPIVEYPNQSVLRPEAKVNQTPLGTANVGGFIYRGKTHANLIGKLVFGDFSATLSVPSGQIFYATPSSNWDQLWPITRLIEIDQRLHSLGEDAEGELYVLTTALGIPLGNTGKVWKIVQIDD